MGWHADELWQSSRLAIDASTSSSCNSYKVFVDPLSLVLIEGLRCILCIHSLLACLLLWKLLVHLCVCVSTSHCLTHSSTSSATSNLTGLLLFEIPFDTLWPTVLDAFLIWMLQCPFKVLLPEWFAIKRYTAKWSTRYFVDLFFLFFFGYFFQCVWMERNHRLTELVNGVCAFELTNSTGWPWTKKWKRLEW